MKWKDKKIVIYYDNKKMNVWIKNCDILCKYEKKWKWYDDLMKNEKTCLKNISNSQTPHFIKENKRNFYDIRQTYI